MGRRKQPRVSEDAEEQEHHKDLNQYSSTDEKSLYEVFYNWAFYLIASPIGFLLIGCCLFLFIFLKRFIYSLGFVQID